ncbi:MAG: dipeptidase, partial [Myxococcota bacterium]|nr:dipeptidase [Myxococcota bacterium]
DGHNDVMSWVLQFGYDLGMRGDAPGGRNVFLWWLVDRWLPVPRDGRYATQTDLERIRRGGLDAQFFSIWPPAYLVEQGSGASRERCLAMIEVLRAQAARYPEHLELATTADDVRRIAAAGRLAALMGVEGGHGIENDLETLRRFGALGVRYMTLTHQNTNDWADSSTDTPRHGGLTDFGREVVREMNRLGMLVDVSHVSDDTFWDALAVTQAPVIASHSSARALVDHPRNMRDEMLRAVAENGGVVMVNFFDGYIDPAMSGGNWAIGWAYVRRGGLVPGPLEHLIDHIEHVARVAGPDHVGLGSDFDGALSMPLAGVDELPEITVALVERGWSDEDVRKLLGGNALRVLEEAERVARASAAPVP